MLVRQGSMGLYDLHPFLAASMSLFILICTAQYQIPCLTTASTAEMDIALLLNSRFSSSARPITPARSVISARSVTSSRQRTTLLTRDQRLQAQTLRTLNWSYETIAQHFRSTGVDCTARQIQYAEEHRSTSQKQRCGLKILLNTPTRRRIADFITSSKRTRRMPYIQVSEELHLFVFEKVMRRAMQKEEIFRRLARQKSPISEKNRLLRLAFAHEHLNWIQLQWNVILWTDETWVTNDRHTRIWVSRRVDEKYETDCIVEKEKYQFDWMFWASYKYKTHTIVVIADHKQSCISGDLGKDLCLFWEKEWETITSKSYCQRILPLIDGKIKSCCQSMS